LNQLPTCQRCRPTSRLAASGERRDGPLDQGDNDRMRGPARPDRGHGLLLAYASARGTARPAGLGGCADAAVGGRDDRRGVDDAAGRLAKRRRGSSLSWLLLGAVSVASLTANVAVAEPSVTGRIIAVWPSFALIGSYELLMRQIRATATTASARRPAHPGLAQAPNSAPALGVPGGKRLRGGASAKLARPCGARPCGGPWPTEVRTAISPAARQSLNSSVVTSGGPPGQAGRRRRSGQHSHARLSRMSLAQDARRGSSRTRMRQRPSLMRSCRCERVPASHS
jgi:hypothetical protein